MRAIDDALAAREEEIVTALSDKVSTQGSGRRGTEYRQGVDWRARETGELDQGGGDGGWQGCFVAR